MKLLSATIILSIAALSFSAEIPQPIHTVLPGLLIPIKQNQPNTAFGTQYTGEVQTQGDQYNISTLVSFGLDQSLRNCHLKFVVPEDQNVEFFSDGTRQIEVFDVVGLTPKVTWNSRPARGKSNGIITVNEKGESNILHFPCRFHYNELELAPVGPVDFVCFTQVI